MIDRATELSSGYESVSAFSKILFKTIKEIARGDSLCTGICRVFGTGETVAFCCSTIKIIPFRDRVYVDAKIISRNCITF